MMLKFLKKYKLNTKKKYLILNQNPIHQSNLPLADKTYKIEEMDKLEYIFLVQKIFYFEKSNKFLNYDSNICSKTQFN